jgi:ankyrin repeat protein
VSLIYYSQPDTILVQNNERWLPLHLTLYFNASSDVIKMLFQAYPQALWDKGYIITLAHSKMIRQAYPECTYTLTPSYEDSPLHFMVENQPPMNVVKMFLEVGLNDTQVQNKNKDLPLHIALIESADHEDVKLKFKANRYSVGVQNERKSLPLHLECQYPAALML